MQPVQITMAFRRGYGGLESRHHFRCFGRNAISVALLCLALSACVPGGNGQKKPQGSSVAAAIEEQLPNGGSVSRSEEHTSELQSH